MVFLHGWFGTCRRLLNAQEDEALRAMNINELSVRKRPQGGDVFRGMQFRGQLAQLSEPRIIILVHGFNVNSESASKRYGEFLHRLEKRIYPNSLEKLGAFIAFHWPGDHPSRGLSVPTFPIRIPVTAIVGGQLARLITERLKPHQEVFFIAHSLGCLVVLETLHAIAEKEQETGRRSGAAVRGIFLMAAAVPYKECRDGIFRRRDPLRPRDWVIHSTDDKVLQRAFPPGWKLYSGDAVEAVGLNGMPNDGRWHCSVPTELGHFDYWKASPVLENVPGMLGALVPRQLPDRPDGSQSGKLPSADLAARVLNIREIGAPLGEEWTVVLEQA